MAPPSDAIASTGIPVCRAVGAQGVPAPGCHPSETGASVPFCIVSGAMNGQSVQVDSVIAWLLLVCAVASAALAVICIVQSITGRQVVRPESSRRSPTQIKRESRWAAGEYSAMTVGLTALLLGGYLLFLACMVVVVASFGGLLRDRRVHSRSG